MRLLVLRGFLGEEEEIETQALQKTTEHIQSPKYCCRHLHLRKISSFCKNIEILGVRLSYRLSSAQGKFDHLPHFLYKWRFISRKIVMDRSTKKTRGAIGARHHKPNKMMAYVGISRLEDGRLACPFVYSSATSSIHQASSIDKQLALKAFLGLGPSCVVLII